MIPFLPTTLASPHNHPHLASVPQVTPFLLERIRTLTGGKSLEANIKLVKNNARVGAAVAVALAGITGRGGRAAGARLDSKL